MPGLSVHFVPYAWPSAECLFFGSGAPENLSAAPHRGLLAVPAVVAMMGAALRACGRRHYDAVVGHWLVPGGLIARWVGELSNLRSLVVGHSGGVHLLSSMPHMMGRGMARRVTRGATTVSSDPLREQLVQLTGREGIEVAPMGFQPSPLGDKRKSGRHGSLRLGFLGRLVPIKGLATVLDALKRVRAEGRDVVLDVVGSGPRRKAWEALAGDGVRFLGAKYGEKKWVHLQRWDALVMPSKIAASGRHEGLPVALLEGASVGAVPLVSGVPGVKKWLVRPTRQVIGDGDVQGWCRALAWLDDLDRQGSKRLSDHTRRRVSELAWPVYSRWWKQWIATAGGESTAPSSRIS